MAKKKLSAAQLAALKKGREARLRNRATSKYGLGSILNLNMFKTNNLIGNLKNAGLVVAGFLIGKEGAEKFIPNDPTNPKAMKNYLSAAAQVGGGLFLAGQKRSELQYLGIGLVGAGLLDGLQTVTQKDFINDGLLKGLTGIGLNLAGIGQSDIDLPNMTAIANKDNQELLDEIIYDDSEDYDDYEDVEE